MYICFTLVSFLLSVMKTIHLFIYVNICISLLRVAKLSDIVILLTDWLYFQLKEKLKHYGVDNIEDLTLVEDSNNDGMNRGFAFLEFSSRSDAMDSFRRLQKRDVVFGVDRPAKVSFADSFVDPGDEIMAQV